MNLPVIGVTTYQAKNQAGYPITALMRAYTEAILQAGGVPLLIPAHLPATGLGAIFKKLDGLLLTGGGDLSVHQYGGEDHPSVNGVDAERDTMELELLQAAERDGKPFLGICRGLQVINVSLGGTLFAHIEAQMPAAIKHDYFPDWPREHLAHSVRIEAGTKLAVTLGETELMVNSLHHQGIKEPSPALQVVAVAPDGLIEAVELSGHPFGCAVQWHPEWLTDQPATRRLFSALVEASKGDPQ
jgi:putative glutamine amidotransferase